MDFLNIAVISLVQGITEFLPVSSSGHLALIPFLTGWPDQGVFIDVAVHVGTLASVMVYFKGHVAALTRAAARPFARDGRLLRCLAVSSIPVILAGAILVASGVQTVVREPMIIGSMIIAFGVLLYIADRFFPAVNELGDITLKRAFFIGLFQTISLIPGVSRSGITMTAARFLGFKRTDAAEFAMLMSIPTIAAAGVLAGVEIYRLGNFLLWSDALLALGLAFLAALAAIAVLMRWLKSASMTIFVVYRILFGAFILWLAA